MTKVTMPEPVAYLRSDQLRKLGEPYSDSPLNEKSDSMMLYAKGTPQAAKQYGHDIAVITTDQAEAYADARVREALEEAVSILEKNSDACRSLAVRVLLSSNADAIRALIPK